MYTPPNQLPFATAVTPGTWRIFSWYDAGSRKTREMAFRVMRRAADEASTPRYQAATRVLSRPKASTAMATPTIVSADRSLWRKAFRNMSFRTNTRDLFDTEDAEENSRSRPLTL